MSRCYRCVCHGIATFRKALIMHTPTYSTSVCACTFCCYEEGFELCYNILENYYILVESPPSVDVSAIYSYIQCFNDSGCMAVLSAMALQSVATLISVSLTSESQLMVCCSAWL